jgi:DNA-binding MarR family transcriptional regulator
MKILRQVAETPGMTQADLARAIATDPALMGRALRGLISRGALRRKRSTVDARAYVIELGPRGLALLERVNEASAKLVERVSVLLDTRDLVDFDRIAKKLIAGLGEGSGAGDRDAAAAHKAKRSARKRA